jgi:RES domain-containing protein
VVLWRISLFQNLDGIGGLRLDGRWHTAGNRVVYLGESPSAVLLEVCVHTAASDVPANFTLLRIEGPEVEVANLPDGSLTPEWTHNPELTQRLGTAWLKARSGVLLRVPSAIVPYTSNYVFNPLHSLASEFSIVEAIAWPFDGRIKR